MPNLQILRFFAAALVLVSHVQHEALKGKFATGDYAPWDFMYFAGGVDIFFVISGFIIFAVSAQDFGRPGAALKFLLRRLVRVAPPYWLFTTLMIVAAMLFRDHITHASLAWDHILASYLFFPFDNAYGQAYPVLMLGYTLNFEVFFYSVFAVSMLFARRRGLSLLYLFIGAFGLIGLLQIPVPMPFSFWGSTLVFEFLMGLSLALARERGLRLPAAAAALSLLFGLALMLLMKALDIAGHYWHLRVFWMGIPALFICAGIVLAPDDQRPLATWRRLLMLLGDASYAIYLSHPFSLNAVALAWQRTGLVNTWLYVALACTVSLLVGVGVHLLVEKPLTRYLNRQVERRFGHRWAGATRPA